MPSLPSRGDGINVEKGASRAKERYRGREEGRFNFARDDKLRPSLFGVAGARFPDICALDEVGLCPTANAPLLVASLSKLLLGRAPAH